MKMKKVGEMSRGELIRIYTEVYGGKLSDLGDGYISIADLRIAVSTLLDADPEDEPRTVRASSEFGFVEQEEAEEIDKEAEAQYEWYTVPGSNAKRRRRIG
jgi:hypothetical protein